MIDHPKEGRAIVLHDYEHTEASLKLETRPVSEPGANEVLVKMSAAAVNPSDLMFIRGLYGVRKPVPVVPGFEGSGIVIAAGSHPLARRLLNKRVSCVSGDGDGAWAEYMTTTATLCFPLNAAVSDEQGAMSFVNPLTAWALISTARKEHAQAVVQTAAASAVGRMIHRLGERYNITVLHIVRRQDQADLLTSMGAIHVLNSTDHDFEQHLRNLCRHLDIHIGFDAVAGSMTGQLLTAMPSTSRVLVYGALALEDIQLRPLDVIFKKKYIEGFYLTHWLAGQNPLSLVRLQSTVAKLLTTDLRSEIHLRSGLDGALSAMAEYEQHMSAGKLVILPGKTA